MSGELRPPALPLRSPLLGADGLLSREWTRFFQVLISRTPQYDEVHTTDLDATNLNLVAAGVVYFGDSATDGSWRITRSGNDLVFDRLESGSWVNKDTISA